MDHLLLIIAAFFSSTLTAILGIGGGMLLISIMTTLLPAAAIVPVHGVTQLASNASRGLFAIRDIRWEIIRPFCIGSLLGTLVGSRVLVVYPTERLLLPLGFFILVMTWLPTVKERLWLPGRFFTLGVVQAVLTLFVGATGPLNMPFLLREGLSKDQIVVTGSALMTIIHSLKIVTYGVLGFTFAAYLPLLAGMICAVIAGSCLGTRLRGRLPEVLFARIFKGLITLLALRMIIKSWLV